MDTLLPILLVTTALAFIAGWLLSKALLAHLYALQSSQPEKPVAECLGVDDRDQQIAELRLQLGKAAARDKRWKRIFRSWRERTRHVTRQFRQQRLVIAELRDELRRRDAASAEAAKSQAAIKQDSASIATPVAETSA